MAAVPFGNRGGDRAGERIETRRSAWTRVVDARTTFGKATHVISTFARVHTILLVMDFFVSKIQCLFERVAVVGTRITFFVTPFVYMIRHPGVVELSVPITGCTRTARILPDLGRTFIMWFPDASSTMAHLTDISAMDLGDSGDGAEGDGVESDGVEGNGVVRREIEGDGVDSDGVEDNDGVHREIDGDGVESDGVEDNGVVHREIEGDGVESDDVEGDCETLEAARVRCQRSDCFHCRIRILLL